MVDLLKEEQEILSLVKKLNETGEDVTVKLICKYLGGSAYAMKKRIAVMQKKGVMTRSVQGEVCIVTPQT